VKAVEKILLNWVCESALHLQTIVSVCVCVTEIQINTLAHTLTFSHIHRHALSHTLNTRTYSHTNTLTYYSQTSTFPYTHAFAHTHLIWKHTLYSSGPRPWIISNCKDFWNRV